MEYTACGDLENSAWDPSPPRRRRSMICSHPAGLMLDSGVFLGSSNGRISRNRQEEHFLECGMTPSLRLSQQPFVNPVWPRARAQGSMLILFP